MKRMYYLRIRETKTDRDSAGSKTIRVTLDAVSACGGETLVAKNVPWEKVAAALEPVLWARKASSSESVLWTERDLHNLSDHWT